MNNNDDQPIARRTRSQTAARRATDAEEAARQRSIHRESERLESERERQVRIQQNFARIGPHDVVANFTAATRASINAAQTTRISERLGDEIQRIRNANITNIQELRQQLRRQLRQPSRAVRDAEERRRQIIEARQIMDVNVSSLYNMSQDLYEYLNVDQMLYFARNSITDNYYFRKLELSYGIPTIDKFNQICQNIIDNIPSNADISALPYRFDIDYYCQIVNFLEQINTQFLLVSNKSSIKAMLISELTNSINNEKITIDNLRGHLTNVLLTIDRSQNTVITAINETISKLNMRYDNLNSITSSIIASHFRDNEFEKIRIYTLYILQAAITLCKIFLLLIIKLYNIHDQSLSLNEKQRKYGEIILNMYDGIANFTYIMSTASSDTNEISLLITIQNTLYNGIKESLLEFRRGRSLEDIIDDYNTQRTPQYSIVYNIQRDVPQELHSLTYELIIEPLNIQTLSRGQRRTRIVASDISTILTTYRDRNRRAARQLRYEAQMQRQQARNDARAAREQAEQAARAARAAARASRPARASRTARPSRTTTAPIQRPPIVTSVFVNTDDMFDINPRAEATYTRTFLDTADNMYTSNSESLLNKLKDKYILYSKDFKTNAHKQVLFNDFKVKFKTPFNIDEPTLRVDSIENYVGHSIASLFSRYIYHSDIKFNDLGKYFVVNYTLEKINDDPATPLHQKYIKIRQAGIDAGGLRRDFITALTSELFEKKILITREGTKKYYLNPFYIPDEEFQYIVKSKSGFDVLTDPLYIKRFYKFIGLLLSFILVNDCGIEHNLSSYIIANFNNASRHNLDNYDYVYFMLNDFPEFTTSILNLMAAPDNIEYTCIGFNDYYQLLPEDKDLDKDNIEEYLILISKFMMTTTILRKDIDIPQGTDMNALITKSMKMHKNLTKGIPDVIKNYFNKIPMNSINSYIVTPTMTDEIVNRLIRNFTNTMNRKNRMLSGPIKAKHEKLTEIFINRILTNPIANPNEDQKEVFFKFIDKLLKFWSGSSFYKENEEYKIQLNLGLSPTHLPQSHTCFFLIDLPDYTIAPEPRLISDITIGNVLYDKIENAILNVEGGIGFAGGNKKLRKIRKL
jgi:hypothetical protein